MKILKYFESQDNFIQQPFYLTGFDYLYISDDLAKQIAPTTEELTKKYAYNVDFGNYIKHNHEDFFNNSKDDNGKYKINRINTNLHVSYNIYRMDIILCRGYLNNNESGHFNYYINGNSGDHNMHGEKVRGTRICNINVIKKIYPILDKINIKNFYTRLKNKELFLDIITEPIKTALENNISLLQYGLPKGMKNMETYYEIEETYHDVNKYNI